MYIYINTKDIHVFFQNVQNVFIHHAHLALLLNKQNVSISNPSLGYRPHMVIGYANFNHHSPKTEFLSSVSCLP